MINNKEIINNKKIKNPKSNQFGTENTVLRSRSLAGRMVVLDALIAPPLHGMHPLILPPAGVQGYRGLRRPKLRW